MTHFEATRHTPLANLPRAAASHRKIDTSFAPNDLKGLEEMLLHGRRYYAKLSCSLAFLLLTLVMCGCGGGYPGMGLTSLTSSAHTIDAGQSATLQAVVTGSLPMQWSLSGDCGSSCGSLSVSSNSAVYVAPASLAAPIHVTVNAQIAGTNNKLQAAITVNPAVVIPTVPATGKVGTAYSAALTTTGGTGAVTLSLASGTLPPGLTFNAATALLSGTPTTVGNYTFVLRASDQSDVPYSISSTQSITISAATLVAAGGALPNGTVATAYTASVSATGGTTPYSWSLVSGTIPPGLTLSAGGALAGTPTTAGSYTFVAKVTDANSATATATYTVQIQNATLVAAGGALANGTVGTAYTANVTATGGATPYTWSLVSGTVPPGLTLSAGGALAGTPTTVGSYTFVAKVTDANSATATATYTVQIQSATLVAAGGALTNGMVGTAYSASTSATGGTTPYSWTVVGGTLPSGLTFSPAGMLTGTPTAAGSYTFMAKVTDANSATANATYTVLIQNATLVAAGGALTNGTVGTAYSASVTATGGSTPYTWAFVSGTLPPGLTLGANGALTGTPTTASSYTFVAKVTDANNVTANATYTVLIEATQLVNAGGTLADGTVGTTYTASVSASGGTSPYSWTLLSGTLPPGLTLSATGAVSGSPTTVGTYTFVAKVTDANSTSANGTYTIKVSAANNLVITSGTLPDGTVNVAYQQTLAITGGTSPYSCSVTTGALPAGLTFGAGCVVSGTPTTAGTVNFTTTTTDASSPALTATKAMSITISGAPVVLTVGQPPTATVGVIYSEPIPVSGGTAPYSCVLKSGTLPAGLTLGTNCVISGTPTTAGSPMFTVTVTDSSSPTTSKDASITMTVNGPAALTFTGSLVDATLGVAYSQTLAATGGTAPYTYAVTTGSLPAGLSLSSTTGVVSGTPTAVGSTTFTVTATDSENPVVTASLQLTLNVNYPVTPYDGALTGPYAFLMQGYDDVVLGVLAYQQSTVGSFTANGMGIITMGEQDSNHQSSNPTTTTVTTQSTHGTYTLNSSYQGSLTISSFNADGTVSGTITYAIAVKAPVAPATVSGNGTLIEADGNGLVGTRGSGMFQAQTALTTATALNGSFAFGLSGDTPCLVSCTVNLGGGPLATVGQFAVTTNGSLSGTADANIATTNYPNAAVTGTASTADGSGRLQLSMSNPTIPSSAYPTDFAVYMIDATHAFVMSTDKHSSYSLLAGSLTAQTTTTFSNASLTGAYVGYENSPTNPGLVGTILQNVLNLSTATVFRGTANATGTLNTTYVDQAGLTGLLNGVTGILGVNVPLLQDLLGTYSSTGNSAYTVGTTGRAVLNYPVPSSLLSGLLGLLGISAQPPAPRVAYLTSPNNGYFLETGYAGLGLLSKEAAAPYTLATLKGTFIYGTQPAASLASINASGTVVADGAGNETSNLDTNVGVGNLNIIQLGTTSTGTYTLNDATAGRYLLTPSGALYPTVVYPLANGQFVILDTNPLTTSPSVALLY
ncbi:MAG: putative Ig domain-containing protein [Acidobacteriaceae bacterium]|nr:putative Ig domain-containing protein [Acidobacteriaceae bacterium]